MGVKDDELEGHGTPQDALNIENFEVFELSMNFLSIPVTHEIRATGVVKTSQEVLGTPDNAGERTMDPTKHPPGQAVAISNLNPCKFHFKAIIFDPTRFDDLARPLRANQWTTQSRIRVVDDAESNLLSDAKSFISMGCWIRRPTQKQIELGVTLEMVRNRDNKQRDGLNPHFQARHHVLAQGYLPY